MSKFSASGDIILNGSPVDGRTHLREDGTYRALDLCEARPGDRIIVGVGGRHQVMLTKEETKEASALEGWTYTRGERPLGAVVSRFVEKPAVPVTLSFSERTKSGASFRTPSVVLHEGLDLNITKPESEQPNIVHRLGVIANIQLFAQPMIEDEPHGPMEL
jgi:hypothetical protein